MNPIIRGVGTAIPSTSLTQDEALGLARVLCSRTAEQGTWLPAIYQGTRIAARHIVLDGQVVRDVLDGTSISKSVYLPKADPADRGPTTRERMEIYAEQAGPLALAAARKALAESRLAPGKIAQLVTVSCTGFQSPGVDGELIRGLALSPDIQRTHIGFMGCHGLINGLRVANAFARSGAGPVLLCAVELCSLHYHYGWDPGKVIANALFSDGAGAMVIAPGESGWSLAGTASHVFPNSANDMTWTIGDHGFEMTLSKRVPMLIQEHLQPWIDSWLGKHELSRERIGSWAIHPGGPKILEAAASALALTDELVQPSWDILADFGNMSSPTLLFILERLRRNKASLPCVMLGFGPGLVVEAALLR